MTLAQIDADVLLEHEELEGEEDDATDDHEELEDDHSDRV